MTGLLGGGPELQLITAPRPNKVAYTPKYRRFHHTQDTAPGDTKPPVAPRTSPACSNNPSSRPPGNARVRHSGPPPAPAALRYLAERAIGRRSRCHQAAAADNRATPHQRILAATAPASPDHCPRCALDNPT